MTVWKKVPGFSRFSASDDGRVRLDVPHGGRLPGEIRRTWRNCYWRVNVSHDWGFAIRAPVHKLVALAFHGEPPFLGAMVLHGDGDHRNNAASNLRYGTGKENVADAVRHGVQVHGEGHPDAKLRDVDVRRIIGLLKDRIPQAVIGSEFGITQSTVSLIARGKKWRHITDGALDRRTWTKRKGVEAA